MLGYASTLIHRLLWQHRSNSFGTTLIKHHDHHRRLVSRCMRTLDHDTSQHSSRHHTPRKLPKYRCPGCQRPIFKFETVQKHIAQCCADLFNVPVTIDTWEISAQHAAAQQLAAQDQAVRHRSYLVHTPCHHRHCTAARGFSHPR